MRWSLLIVIAIAVVTLIVIKVKRSEPKGTAQNNTGKIQLKSKKILTFNEQGMYNRLVQALPNSIVLAQVSFGALLKIDGTDLRILNKFIKKRADFVVCDKTFTVQAIIELDDSSHRGNEAKDAERDAMLKQAGYKVLRYQHVPDIDQVKTDVCTTERNKPKRETRPSA
jgi:hypothetical protein